MTLRVVSVLVLGGAFCLPVCAQQTGGSAPEIKRLNPSTLPKPAGYSQVVTVHGGRLIFVSGQVGMKTDGQMVGADFRAQVDQAFANLKAALEAAGATPRDVVKLNYFVVGLSHERLLALREARNAMFDADHAPASTLAGVQSLFREDALIEIEAEAAVP